jgi:hypothetical protein
MIRKYLITALYTLPDKIKIHYDKPTISANYSLI